MAGEHDGVIGQAHQGLVEAAVHRLGVAAREVDSTTTSEEEGIAGYEPARLAFLLDEEALAKRKRNCTECESPLWQWTRQPDDAAPDRVIGVDRPANNEAETSVGMRIHIDHLSPSGPGAGVMAEAVLEAVEGRRLTFGATAMVGDTVVATASIVRVVVATERFVGRVDAKTD